MDKFHSSLKKKQVTWGALYLFKMLNFSLRHSHKENAGTRWGTMESIWLLGKKPYKCHTHLETGRLRPPSLACEAIWLRSALKRQCCECQSSTSLLSCFEPHQSNLPFILYMCMFPCSHFFPSFRNLAPGKSFKIYSDKMSLFHSHSGERCCYGDHSQTNGDFSWLPAGVFLEPLSLWSVMCLLPSEFF